MRSLPLVGRHFAHLLLLLYSLSVSEQLPRILSSTTLEEMGILYLNVMTGELRRSSLKCYCSSNSYQIQNSIVLMLASYLVAFDTVVSDNYKFLVSGLKFPVML